MAGKMPYYWLMASVRDRRYERLTAERVLRWGMHVLIHHEDLRAASADASVALFPIEALAYENGAFKAKFARYDGFIASFSAHLLMRAIWKSGPLGIFDTFSMSSVN